MLSDLSEGYKRVVSSKKIDGYLCSVFVMANVERLEQSNWQFDFYDKKKDTITSYVCGEEIKEINTDSDVFKEDHVVLKELDLAEVKFSFEEALRKAKKILKTKHESANKVIVVLQYSKIQMWNITFLTNTFNMLNIKISAKNGKVVEEKLASLLSFKNA